MSIETMTKLATVTVGSGGSASVSFSNIPQTYTDLSLLISSRNTNNDGSDNMFISLNGSSSNFSGRYLFTNTNGTLTSGTDTTPAGAYNGGNTTASTFSNVSVYFPSYTSANYKSFSVDSVAENNGTQSNLYFDAKLWSSTEAITSMSFTCTSGNFAQHTTFTLYGIRNARRTAGNSIKATGGNISFDGTYVVHTFNASGTFTPTVGLVADYLVVAGGGGGGGDLGGGGGAGGLRSTVTATGGGGSLESALSLTSGTAYTVTIGAGGAGNTGTAVGTNGSNSVFSTITSTGGGGGGGDQSTVTGNSGGSGGGASSDGGSSTARTGASGTANQGFKGGNKLGGAYYQSAAGGGGAGAAGSDQSSTTGGNGGNGVATSISGSSVTYAGGGGGGCGPSLTSAGTGGTGGGGNGGKGTGVNGSNGTTNTGGGGGGPGTSGADGGSGGSGIVIIRYKA